MIGADRFGPDSPETPFLRALRPAAEKAGVNMLGYRAHAEVLATMRRAAIVVVPSRWAEPSASPPWRRWRAARPCYAAHAAVCRRSTATPPSASSPRTPLPSPTPSSPWPAIPPGAPHSARPASPARACSTCRRPPAALDVLRSELLDTWSRGLGRPI